MTRINTYWTTILPYFSHLSSSLLQWLYNWIFVSYQQHSKDFSAECVAWGSPASISSIFYIGLFRLKLQLLYMEQLTHNSKQHISNKDGRKHWTAKSRTNQSTNVIKEQSALSQWNEKNKLHMLWQPFQPKSHCLFLFWVSHMAFTTRLFRHKGLWLASLNSLGIVLS